ncbi:ornithine carbamoyltransferase [Dactylosporangium maewongense]|uniref:Ornithine carbamoyltransferase n=2 Tax=Micromonosporaceae TaxID=28056 RepID=A0ABN2BKT6_9ACTN
MSGRSLISIADLTTAELEHLVARSGEYFTAQPVDHRPLRDKVVGVLFTVTSTRTRTAFSSGVARLGGTVVAYGPRDLQLVTGETLDDTARVFGGMLDALVVRDPVPMADLRRFADVSGIPVINAMVREEHPTQGVSDVAMLRTHFGRLDGLHVGYFGEGNNSATALALGLAKVPGPSLSLATPSGYGLDPAYLAEARQLVAGSGRQVREVHDVNDLGDDLDVVYTTQWCTTGTTKPDPDWRRHFEPFAVTEDLMSRWPGAVFMHDLPAHRGEEVAATVLDGPRSIAWAQARMKLASAMAVLEWCLGG